MDENLTQNAPETPEVEIKELPMALNLEGEMPEPEKKEKTPTKLWVKITALVLAVVILAVGVLGFVALDWGLYVRDFFQRMKSPEDYKNIVETRAITEGGVSELSLAKEQLLKLYTNNRDLAIKGGQDITVQVQMDNSLKNLLNIAAGTDAQLKETVAAFSDVELTLSLDNGDKNLAISASLDNQATVITLDGYLDVENEIIYLTVPQWNQRSYELPCSKDPRLQELVYRYRVNQQYHQFLASCPDPQAMEQLLDQYLVLAVEQIHDVTRENGKIQAGDVKQRVTVLTYDITDKTVNAGAIALLKHAKNDKAVTQILAAYNEAATNINAINQEKAQAGLGDTEPLPAITIDDLIAQLEKEETTGKTLLTVTTYVNKKGQIVGRTYTAGETSFGYRLAVKGRNVGIAATFRSEQTDLDAQVTTKYRKGKLSGEGNVLLNGEKCFTLTMTDVALKAPTGTITLSACTDLKTILGESVQTQLSQLLADILGEDMGVVEMLFELDRPGIALHRQEKGLNISLLVNKSEMLHLTADRQIRDGRNLAAPEKSVKRIAVWALTTDWSAAKDTAVNFGVDQFITKETLLQLLMNFFAEKISG